ncbi:ABC transporter ATP-binding protein [Paraliomyxa miuraensis]|uniref:ABC transporter ATP-binding protein n=1 Tax=Paraliomyxa miuraensis TaxID=376150 RepID=UPI00225B320A|nr:ABC transporter ATP-binding protein [Paraliomyxa miuraensis]MCX4246979.1 ABC transporter ATP-binding protein [Paraliomyxa miuraensis]
MIEATGLTRYYGDFPALQDASFTIADREIVGLLGLNGAGKSTAMKILAGLLLPSAGTVKVGGVDAVLDPDALRRKIGFLPEEPPLYREMRVREFLQWCGELKGRTRKQVADAMPTVLQTCDLTHVAERVIGELSHGYKKRVGIAQAIIHRPEVVILDEPISGLDPQQIVEMRKVVRSLKEFATVLISSHILSEIEQTCDRILVIHKGKLVAEGSDEELSARGERDRNVALMVRGGEAELRAVLDQASFVERYELAVRDGEGHRELAAKVVLTGDHRKALVNALVQTDLELRELTAASATSDLERVFLKLTSGEEAKA